MYEAASLLCKSRMHAYMYSLVSMPLMARPTNSPKRNAEEKKADTLVTGSYNSCQRMRKKPHRIARLTFQSRNRTMPDATVTLTLYAAHAGDVFPILPLLAMLSQG